MAELAVDRLCITDLPTVAVTHILSYLTWQEKLDIAVAIPPWQTGLHSAAAWHCIHYGNEADENVYFLKEKRTKFLFCVKHYGKYIRCVSITFEHKIGHLALKMLQAVSDFCLNLKVFIIAQETPVHIDENPFWRRSTVNAVCNILQSCQSLKCVHINQPIIDWSETCDNNILKNLVSRFLVHKVVHLELSAESFWEHEGFLDILTKFSNLKSLVIRREKINNSILMSLIKNGLQEVTIIQEEEIPLQQQEDFKENFWTEVLQICPHFKIDMILRYIMVIKDLFAAKMPLRALILDDLVNIVTKGVLEHLLTTYKDTLQKFMYTNSLLEMYETGDRRVPYSLVHMAQTCTKLETLVYGFPVSSTTILLIAKARRLKELVIPAVEVSYEMDWDVNPEWSTDFVAWIQEAGKSEQDLQRTVSELLGFPWRLSSTPLDFCTL